MKSPPVAPLYITNWPLNLRHVQLTVDTFHPELAAALRNYDSHVVCLDKLTDACEVSLRSLMQKAINAYVNRGPEMRHGIALDRHLTIILSQSDGDRPLCGIYFNLHTPYARKPAVGASAAAAAAEQTKTVGPR